MKTCKICNKNLIEVMKNNQHKVILKLLLSGMTAQRIRNMKYCEAINLLPDTMLEELTKLKKIKSCFEYIFLTNRGKKYTLRTIYKIKENAIKKYRKASLYTSKNSHLSH